MEKLFALTNQVSSLTNLLKGGSALIPHTPTMLLYAHWHHWNIHTPKPAKADQHQTTCPLSKVQAKQAFNTITLTQKSSSQPAWTTTPLPPPQTSHDTKLNHQGRGHQTKRARHCHIPNQNCATPTLNQTCAAPWITCTCRCTCQPTCQLAA